MKKLVLQKSKDAFNQIAEQQELKGIKKYGKELDALDKYDWLEMAQEEFVDGFKYLQAEKMRRQFIITKIKNIVDNESMEREVEILYWLDRLQGNGTY